MYREFTSSYSERLKGTGKDVCYNIKQNKQDKTLHYINTTIYKDMFIFHVTKGTLVHKKDTITYLPVVDS